MRLLFLFTSDCYWFSFSCSCISFCVLSSYRKSLLMSNPSITSDFLESLNIPWNKSPEVTFDHIVFYLISDEIKLCFWEIIYLACFIYFYRIKYSISCCSPDTIYIGESDICMFSTWEYDSGDSYCHNYVNTFLKYIKYN